MLNEHIHIFALGGLDEEGKNLTVVQINDDIFVIDAGVKLPDKSTPGIDCIIADYQYLKEHKNQIRAYLITHGHDDQHGALAFLLKDCPAPVYCTEVTKIFIVSFLSFVGAAINVDFHIVEPTEDIEIAGRTIHFFATCHAMPQSSGVAIETTNGNIVYSSDFIIENNSFKSFSYDANAVARIAEKPTLLLMTESLYATRPGYTTPNHRLTPHISNIFANATTGRIFVAIYSTNAFALAELIQLAKENKRKICPYDRETENLIKRYKLVEECSIAEQGYLSPDDFNRVPNNNILVVMMGFNENLFKKMRQFANGHSQLRVNFLPDDTFIVAAPPTPRHEVLAVRSLDMIYRTGINVINISHKDYLSLHPSEEDLKAIISIFHPKYYFPIKGNFRNMVANASIALNMKINLSHGDIFVLENGLVLDINGGVASVLPGSQSVPVGEIYIDGTSQTNANNSVITDRLKLGEDGAIIVSSTVSCKQHKIIGEPIVEFYGVTCIKDLKTVRRIVINDFVFCTNELLIGNFNRISAETILTDRLSKTMKREIGKEPLIVVIINNLD